MEGKKYYIDKITDQLGWLLAQVQIAIRSNRPDRNVIAEDILCGLMNRIHGWKLQNANAIRQNFAGVDLVDPENHVTVQVTSTNTMGKVQNTLEKFDNEQMKQAYHKLYILIITLDKPSKSMKEAKLGTWFDGETDIWNISSLMRQTENIESVEHLKMISDYLAEQLGGLDRMIPRLPRIPAPSRSFLDGSRDDDLEALKEKLREGKPIFICGVGGIGKTETAIQLGRKHPPVKGAYFLRYFGKKGEGSLRESILRTEFANYSFKGTDNDSRDREYKERMAIIEREHPGAVLVIDHFDQAGMNIDEMLREDTYKKLAAMDLQLVFTTRNQVPDGYCLKPLDEPYLMELMRKNLGSVSAKLPDEELRQLLEAVDHHTLMAILIARTIAKSHGNMKTEKILEAMNNSTLNNKSFRVISNEHNEDAVKGRLYDHMKALFDLSEMTPEEEAVLRIATLLPEDGMAAGLFQACLEDDAQDTMESLIEQGWLSVDAEDVLTIHPVLREVCREELKPEKEHCTAFLDALYHHFSPDQEYDAAQFLQIARCFSRAAEMPDDTDREWSRRASKFWTRVGRHQTAVKYQQRVVEYCQSKLPPLHPDLAEAYEEMGGILCALGETQAARGYTEKALKIYKKVQPVPYEGLATANLSMGMVYDAFGNRKKAMEYKLEAVKIRREHLADNQLGLAKVYSSLGSTYAQLKKYEMALQHQEEALRIRLDLLDETHPSVLDSMSLVATAHEKLGQADKAMELHQQVLQLRRQILPQDHPKLAISYSQIGIIHMKAENYADAYRYLRRAQQIQVKSLPANHKKRKDTTQNLKHVVDTLEKRGEPIPADLDEQ